MKNKFLSYFVDGLCAVLVLMALVFFGACLGFGFHLAMLIISG